MGQPTPRDVRKREHRPARVLLRGAAMRVLWRSPGGSISKLKFSGSASARATALWHLSGIINTTGSGIINTIGRDRALHCNGFPAWLIAGWGFFFADRGQRAGGSRAGNFSRR